MTFRDQVVLITGASSGIGRALATEFARHGARLALVARNAEKLKAVAQSLPGGPHWILPADVTKPDEVERATATVGRIDVLVNNAGIGHCAALADMSLEEFRTVMETNFFGVFHFLKAVVPGMIERRAGLVVQISSVNGFCSVPLASAYCASKFALEGLSQSARMELHRHNVRMLIVRPGVTDTDFFDNSKHFRQKNPFQLRNLMPADVAAAKIVRAAARRKHELVLTADGKMLWWLKKFSPALVDRILLHYVKARPQSA
jgi:dehydrogenase/reductase SDR family member 7B